MKLKITYILFLVFLASCSSEDIEYAGQYIATLGEDCVPEDAKGTEQSVLEIIQKGKGDTATYIAKMPLGTAWNLPTVSQETKPSENNELHFSFIDEGETGLFGGKPAIDMSIVVVPNSDKENHLWLKRWDATMGFAGQAKHLNPLEDIRKASAKNAEIKFSDKGLCLKKQI